MLEPYKLVIINIVLCFILLCGILIYLFIYPKKKINLLVLLIIISLLPLVSMLRAGTYQSGDLSTHALWTTSFFKILFTEHIIPRWAPEFYAGYGDPFFLFAYFLPYLIASIFHFIGFSFLASVKLLLAFSFIFSGIFMYIFVKDELGERAGFISGIFYLFAPFHLVNMHFQVTVAMTLSYVFPPLILFLTKKIIISPKPKWFIFFSISEVLLILSHQVISLSFFPITILYALFLVKDKNKKINRLFKFFTSLIFGLMLSMFYWLPIISESKFTQLILLKKESLLFPSISQLLYSPWRYGLLFQGHKGELSYIIGYTQIFVILLSLYLFINNKYDKKIKKIFLFFITITITLIFLILPISYPLWFIIPLIKFFQFSTRLLIPLSLSIAVLAGIVINTLNKKWFFILLCSMTVMYTILNWGNRTTIPGINDKVLIAENTPWPNISSTYGAGPESPIWINLNKNISRQKRIDDISIISGTARIKQTIRTSTNHEYIIDVKSNSVKLKENTFYFPGWVLSVDNKVKNIDYQTKENMGIITFVLNKGMHDVRLEFKNTPIRNFSDTISILSAIILIIFIMKNFLFSKIYPVLPRIKASKKKRPKR